MNITINKSKEELKSTILEDLQYIQEDIVNNKYNFSNVLFCIQRVLRNTIDYYLLKEPEYIKTLIKTNTIPALEYILKRIKD